MYAITFLSFMQQQNYAEPTDQDNPSYYSNYSALNHDQDNPYYYSNYSALNNQN